VEGKVTAELCIVGVGQRTWRAGAPEPLDIWEEVSRAALADASVAGSRLDSVQVVYSQSWQYDDPPCRLAERLGATPSHSLYSGIGGTTPQVLVNQLARNGAGLTLIVGGEALANRRRLKKAGEKPQWSHGHPGNPPMPFDDPFHPAEMAHQVWEAWLTFALFDVARRAHLGAAPYDHVRANGAVMARLSTVAARSPHAWFPDEVGVDELATPTPDNRLVGYPYTKRMVAVMDVDMAAALVVATREAADELGVPAEKRVYLRGAGYATDPPYVAAHPDLWRSPAMATAASAALTGAAVGIEDVAHLDLYSCFASSLTFACDALGIDPLSRPLTVTGGLPYFGGPGSNYVTHSLATMTEVLRADPGSFGMVSGVGMHMQKHAFGVYSTEPGPVEVPSRVTGPPASVAIRDTHTGPATVATYSVVHDRSGERAWGVAICDVDGGERCYARIEDPGLLEEAERTELVGTAVDVTATDGGVNLVRA
jgi:acetyl-CoA C-acetyltransferase